MNLRYYNDISKNTYDIKEKEISPADNCILHAFFTSFTYGKSRQAYGMTYLHYNNHKLIFFLINGSLLSF